MRIVVHTMHEEETDTARRMLQDAAVTDSFVMGTGSDETVKLMRGLGLIVQVVDPGAGPAEGQPETPGLGAATFRGQRRPSVFTVRNFAEAATDLPDLPDLGKPNVYLIQIPGPLLDEYRHRLDQVGVKLLQGFGASYYSATMTFPQRRAVGELPFVANIMLYDSAQTVPGRASQLHALGAAGAGLAAVARMAAFDVRLHRAEDLGTVRAWLEDRRVPIAGAEDRKIRIYALEDSPVLSELAALAEVQAIEEFVPPQFFNDRARTLLNLDGAGGPTVPYDGTGEIIGIADSGVDDKHADFAGRLLALIPRGRATQTDDPHGHGTHVAGSAAGGGAVFGRRGQRHCRERAARDPILAGQ